ncbi:hypothetical protein H1C71_021523 [Ictidomys tridecemlineatus]|nr:hypothetical protein H1C71_021523 [Ictidomys tridecemlineatus]
MPWKPSLQPSQVPADGGCPAPTKTAHCLCFIKCIQRIRCSPKCLEKQRSIGVAVKGHVSQLEVRCPGTYRRSQQLGRLRQEDCKFEVKTQKLSETVLKTKNETAGMWFTGRTLLGPIPI